MKCCGVTKPDDFYPVLNSTDLPRSCCLSLAKDKPCTKTDASKIGCKSALLEYLSNQSTILAGVAVAVGLVQVRLLSLSKVSIRNKEMLKIKFSKQNYCTFFLSIKSNTRSNYRLLAWDTHVACIVHSVRTTKPSK